MSAEKHIRKILMGLLAVVLFCLPLASFAEDYKTPHKFKPGDVISADVMNEIFDYIEITKKTISLSDLIGTWQCSKYISKWATNAYPVYLDTYTPVDSDKLWYYTTITFEFIDDGDGTYSWRSYPHNAFEMRTNGDTCEDTGNVSLFKNMIAANFHPCPGPYQNQEDIIVVSLNVKSNSKIEMIGTNAAGYNGPIIDCDKQKLPPNIPINLITTISGLTVALSWTDTSNDETGFKVLRRDSLEGEYNEIAKTNANIISFQDTLPSSGTYWYRVKATNEYGDSLGSNVVKVIVSEVKN